MFIRIPGPGQGFRRRNRQMITIRRVYDAVPAGVSYKVLVDRLWPRGISRESTPWDEWLRDISPSDALRKEFHHDASRWPEFKERYLEELSGKTELLAHLKALEKDHQEIVLMYAARDTAQNNAVVLRDLLLEI